MPLTIKNVCAAGNTHSIVLITRGFRVYPKT
ncbi:hypothetical protein MVUOKPPV_CDS0143 [Klebsiella phage phi1_175008]|uniref:Uncharacterized protein n=1 Tax=Klebsiella phage phi1_175008 TaxID=3127744 RepID=A0ACD5FR61_9CAUD